MNNLFLYSSPTVLYAVGIVTLFVLFISFWRITDRNYTEIAEDYFNRNYLDYSDRLDNIVKPIEN